MASSKNTLVFFLLLALGLLALSPAAKWNHNLKSLHGPNYWCKTYPECAKSAQSPIDLSTFSMTKNSSLQPFDFSDYHQPVDGTLKNVGGHTVQFTLKGNKPIYVRGGSLPPFDYQLLQLHFHWGINNGVGSEHTVDGQAFPLEMHLVHKRPGKDVSEPQALAVVGFLFRISVADNHGFDKLLSNFGSVTNSDTEIPLNNVNLFGFIRGAQNSQYARYAGSLTTPPCFESVVWSVMMKPLPISARQMAKFRTLLDSHGSPIENNFRPVQPINGREVGIKV